MENIRPLGSEKLQGDEKIKRILEIANYQRETKPKRPANAEYISENVKGYVYGIVRERNDYYVKKGLNENSLDYIGGMFMKNKNKFSSYAEALKRLNLITGQEALNEEKRYVLKRNKPESEAQSPEPSMSDLPPVDDVPDTPTPDAADIEDNPLLDDGMNNETEPPEGEYGTEPDLTDDEQMGDEAIGADDGEELRSSYMGEIQKYSGKLGQELRDQKERMESDDIKYVLNMIISAVDLSALDPEDLEDISDKFEKAGSRMEEPGIEPEFEGEPEPEAEMSEQEMSAPDPRTDGQRGDSLDISNFSDLKEDGEEEQEGFVQPGWLETLWNVNPGLAEKAERDLKKAMGFGEEESFGDDEEEIFGDEEMYEDDTNDTSYDELSSDDEDVEIDIDEMMRDINKSVNGTLSKYFK